MWGHRSCGLLSTSVTANAQCQVAAADRSFPGRLICTKRFVLDCTTYLKSCKLADGAVDAKPHSAALSRASERLQPGQNAAEAVATCYQAAQRLQRPLLTAAACRHRLPPLAAVARWRTKAAARARSHLAGQWSRWAGWPPAACSPSAAARSRVRLVVVAAGSRRRPAGGAVHSALCWHCIRPP